MVKNLVTEKEKPVAAWSKKLVALVTKRGKVKKLVVVVEKIAATIEKLIIWSKTLVAFIKKLVTAVKK